MKKLVILFAMVFAVSMIMAQNDVDLSQTGANQEADIGQTGSNNDADVTQFTDNDGKQVSEVIQNGKRNTVQVEQNQTGGGDNGMNRAFIQQVGNDNYGKQYENAPGSNGGQRVTAYQTGNLNDVRQSIFSGYTESFYTEQIGHKNDAIQEATGGGHNHGHVFQWGHENWAKQEIFGSNHGYMSAEIKIVQDGSLNDASQLFQQGGSGTKNNGEIYQYGDENYAYQEAIGKDLDLQLWQRSDDNRSVQKSWGNNNVSYLDQLDANNKSEIIQDGDNNSTKLYHSGSGNIKALQEGNYNKIAGIDYSCEELEWGDVFNLKATQLGEYNELFITSNGSVTVMQDNSAAATMLGNTIKYYQYGVGNTKLSQVGDENKIGLIHGGNGNVNIKQEGNGNKVGSFVDVFADPAVMSDPCCGHFNGIKADIDQLGNGNLLHLNSTGFSDNISVMQSGNNHAASIVQTP